MPIRTHYKEADIRRLLDAGMNNTQIARRLRVTRDTAARVRKTLGYPPGRARHRVLNLEEKFVRDSIRLDNGHVVWTGQRTQDCAPVLTHRGRKLSARKVAFRIEHGRDPVGNAKSSCEYGWCVAPEHQQDAEDRAAQRAMPAQLDAAGALLGGAECR
ncbi:hypothetical protein [Streptomyces anandii]|uniref:hypothetical protein n=1 Tax=Streptomyces anandii TaxID=285454 RepID=UPI00378BB814